MTVAAIIKAFGGTSAMAKALGVPISTVHSWKAENTVPDWRQPAIMALALERGISLSTADFPDKRQAA